jgi:hypothetical protein
MVVDRASSLQQEDQPCEYMVGAMSCVVKAQLPLEIELHLMNNDQSCLCNDTPITSLDTKAQWSLLIGVCIYVPGGV